MHIIIEQEEKLTVGAIRPPNMIIPDINDKLVKYSCFNVFGVYFKRKMHKMSLMLER